MNPNGAAVPPIPLFSKPRLLRLGLLLLFLFGAALWLSSRAILSANFLPHWYCYAGNTRVLWTTVIADLFIGLSYVVISTTLAFIVRRAGRDLPYQGFFWAFGLFIVSCGVTHFMEILTVWEPVYWLSATAKIITAVASVATAAVLLVAAGDIIEFVLTARQLAARRGDEKFRALQRCPPCRAQPRSRRLGHLLESRRGKNLRFHRTRCDRAPLADRAQCFPRRTSQDSRNFAEWLRVGRL